MSALWTTLNKIGSNEIRFKWIKTTTDKLIRDIKRDM